MVGPAQPVPTHDQRMSVCRTLPEERADLPDGSFFLHAEAARYGLAVRMGNGDLVRDRRHVAMDAEQQDLAEAARFGAEVRFRRALSHPHEAMQATVLKS